MTAIAKLNGMKLGEKNIFVGEFQKFPQRQHHKHFTNVYAKHIPDSVDETCLNKVIQILRNIRLVFC